MDLLKFRLSSQSGYQFCCSWGSSA
ncbi:hypothetical protein Gotri_027652 [Gossypium trilobum]|uniref:Uncharacterized protein n=1 Tax=Gossypium trilobum TaxID=34281 RepID=A0A7J9FJT5_9ROSI|nr:hypothetical protein [Gossypium trilobum]